MIIMMRQCNNNQTFCMKKFNFFQEIFKNYLKRFYVKIYE